jgi:hypothetical protein
MVKSDIREMVDQWIKFYGKGGRHFWIQLPSGPVGRPFDNFHSLVGIVFSEDKLEVNFDSKNQIIIVEPTKALLRRDGAGTIYLIFSGFSSYSLSLNLLGEDRRIETVKTLNPDSQIKLIGYSPDMSDPGSYPDINYRRLFSNAKLV